MLQQEKLVSEQLQIAIVGGGIGGLTTALALRARGLTATVFEQAGELREIGAGVSLFPNPASQQPLFETESFVPYNRALISARFRTPMSLGRCFGDDDDAAVGS